MDHHSSDDRGYDHEQEQEAYEQGGGATSAGEQADPDAGPASAPQEVDDRDQAEGAPGQVPDA